MQAELRISNKSRRLTVCVIFLTLETFHLEISELKDEANVNASDKSITLPTSHEDKSPLKLRAS